MKRCSFLFALVVALVFAGVIPASAGTLDWTVSGAGISGSGILVLGAEVGTGVFQVLSIAGNFTDINNGISGDITDPFPAGTYPNDTLLSSDGLYYYDNLLYFLSSGEQLLSNYPVPGGGGLLFDVNGGVGSGGDEVNIAGNGSIGSGYSLWETTPSVSYLPSSGAGYAVEFSISGQCGDTPEPVTLILLGSGLSLVGIIHRRRRA